MAGEAAGAQFTGGGRPAVILDATMLERNGTDVLREIHRLHPENPVIMMSGYLKRDMLEALGGQSVGGFLRRRFVSADPVTRLCEAAGVRS